MIHTLSIRDLEKKADNIYEAVIILAKRARQLNNEQKQRNLQEQDYEEDYDYVEDEITPIVDQDYEKLPKPSTLALEEYLKDKVIFDYQPDPDDDEETSES